MEGIASWNRLKEPNMSSVGKKLEIGMVAKDWGRTPDVYLKRISDFGFSLCQLGGVSDSLLFGPDRNAHIAALKREMAARNITISALWIPFRGQTWGFGDGPATLGLVPEATRAERMIRACMTSQTASELGIDVLAAHVGFIPEEGNFYRRFIEDMRRFLEYCRNQGQTFIFETGMESVETLERFFRDLDMPNIGLNFDPANLLIYNFDDPGILLDKLGRYVVNMHVKDGRRPTRPATLGSETPVGEGDAHVADMIRRLYREFGYTGPLVIEREIDESQQEPDIRKTTQLLEALRQELGV